MSPSDIQIARSAYGAIQHAQSSPETANLPNTLEGARVALNELILRAGLDFHQSFLRDGLSLAAEGRQLLGAEASRDLPALPAATGEDVSRAALDTAVEDLFFHNAALVAALSASDQSSAQAVAARLADWELGLYAHRMQRAMAVANAGGDPRRLLTAERLQAYLRRRMPEWPNVEVLKFRVQPGGFSKITVIADLKDDANGEHGVVIRAEPPRRMLDLDGMVITAEYPAVRYAFEAGLPVAEPYLLETDASHLGMRFMLSKRMPGRVLGSFEGSAEAIGEHALKDVIALMARIANTPVDSASPQIRSSHLDRWMNYSTLADNTRAFVDYWHQVGVTGRMPHSPLVMRGYTWLMRNVPEENARPAFLHGDVGFHNILFDDGRLVALLDWENCRYGDPAEDLTNFIKSVTNQASPDQIRAWYREAGGPEISEYRLRYFDVYHCFKIAVSGLVSLQRVEESPEENIHLAVFGLQYLYHVAHGLNELIARAEEEKRSMHRG